ncbi:hypothetical protein Poly41_22600 [Novipirellula artificiosorum]|uniref:BON domain-containing protein n=1 Tax=Novipirellula artificiosorum TaxID=2528016 RepID=A0A5C6DWJ5_9BACT|nr:hypothetical protein Poly41_22600 [Novipirellula artificiosorum]
MSIEKRIIRGLQRLECNDIQVIHHGGGRITLVWSNKSANERALVVAATKTVPGVTEVNVENGKP